MSKTAGYLRVKNWSDFQHYSDRRPPWIKLHAKVLDSGDDFMALGELEQWQLVRLWLVASRAERFVEDDQGKVVPVITDDEGSLRRSTMSLRRIPLGPLITAGWLIQVQADDVFTLAENGDRALALGASTDASATASALASGRANTREQEVSEELEQTFEDEAKNASSSTALATVTHLPVSAQTLTGWYIDQSRLLGADPPSRLVGQIAKQCRELLDEGITAGNVQAGLSLMLEKRLGPALLPSLVHEAALPPRRQSRPGLITPSELRAHAQQLREQEEKMFHDAG